MSARSQPIRFLMIGGFLGAGKTTSIARLARHYIHRGQKVGIVTNDQASDLVDTNSLRAQGFDVGEVAGACFCCHFNDLIQTMESLDETTAPDIILVEPVGSCTDLVATVIQPIKQLYQAEFTIAPYAVILKPSQGLRILRNEAGTGFSPKAAYIFEKQLEEADLILVNRADQLEPEQIQQLQTLLRERLPQTPVLPISAKTGQGFDAYLQMLEQQGDFGRRVLDIDYDIYAEGEAELGWLNSSQVLKSAQPFDLDSVLLGIVDQLRSTLQATGFEAAHLKAIGLWEGFFGVANLVSSRLPAELSLPSQCQVTECHLIVNARVACDPATLGELTEMAVTEVCRQHNIVPGHAQVQKFRPGRPVPTHRLAVPGESVDSN